MKKATDEGSKYNQRRLSGKIYDGEKLIGEGRFIVKKNKFVATNGNWAITQNEEINGQNAAPPGRRIEV